MKTIVKPNYDIEEIITDCVSSVRKSETRQRYLGAIKTMKQHHNDLDSIMTEKQNKPFKMINSVTKKLSKDELVNLYGKYFSKQRNLARKKYYDKIMTSTENGQCPFCGVGAVRNLDHFLIKSAFPCLAVSPVNLVPICRDCNTGAKKDIIFTSYEDSHLHPYYDAVDSSIWLHATIQNSNGTPIVEYSVLETQNYDDLLFKRINNHFNIFQLANVFCKQANDEILNTKYRWGEIKKNAGVEVLKKDLLGSVQSYEHQALNSWRTALYRALASSTWFLDEYIN